MHPPVTNLYLAPLSPVYTTLLFMLDLKKIVYCFLLFLVPTSISIAQDVIPKPIDVLGFEPGADYELANYAQISSYLQQLDAASDRVEMIEIGTSVLGRPLYLMFISSEENLKHLETWRAISEKLARARIDETQALQLANEGKAIVWIDAGMHATERACAQMVPALAYKIATEESAEMQEIRDNVIVLLMPNMNPDGLDIVASWYKKHLGTPFETTSPTWLYHHYVGHDNNRDWFMNNMPETEAVSTVLYNQWYPQIVHNHHQTSPAWARIFLPPFADPVNPNIHPGVTTGVNLVGTAMANRFAMKKMPGVVSDFQYSMWWNGGMRTAPYFHNQIGILTEVAHAIPTPRYYDPESRPKTLGSSRSNTPTSGTDIFYPYPWEGGESRFRDAVDYMITASMGILSIAAERREKWLYNVYAMGRDAIESAEEKGPYAYVIPTDQWDPSEAYRLARVLRKTGIELHRATRAFSVDKVDYDAGSFIVYGGQAYRPMLTDLMEPQAYPDRRGSDGKPQIPYDLAGWTLPMQMGVRVDAIASPFTVSVEEILDSAIPPPKGLINRQSDIGYLISHNENTSVEAVNRLLAEGERISWIKEPIKIRGQEFPSGTLLIESNENTHKNLDSLVTDLGINVYGLSREYEVEKATLSPPKVGLYKSWVANMDEGWTRWLLKQFAFPVDTLHDATVQSIDLSSYDAIVLPSQDADRLLNGHAAGTRPAEYTGGLGLEGTLALKNYVEQGGTLIALDAASDFAIEQFGLPVRNVVKDTEPEQFFIPGSLIRTHIDTNHPIAFGMQEEVAVSFQRSRAFQAVRLSNRGEGGEANLTAAPEPPVQVIAQYAEEDILMSGWALGEDKYIGGKAALMNIPFGNGNVVLFGFRPQFRGQPGGTYKLFFNAIHAATIGKTEDFVDEGDSLPSPAGN